MNDSIADLARVLEEGNASARCDAAEQLSRLGEAARVAAVPLVRAVADSEEATREWAVAALESLGAPSAEDAGRLADLLSDQHTDVGYWAATLLGRLGAEAAVAVPQLASAVAAHFHRAAQERAAWALGKIGPTAADARSVLERAAQGSNPRLVRIAQQALRQIQP